MTAEYPPLNFSTGLDMDGMDMAEWVSHAYLDLCKVKIALATWGWDEQSDEAKRIGHDLLELLESMKERAEKEGGQ